MPDDGPKSFPDSVPDPLFLAIGIFQDLPLPIAELYGHFQFDTFRKFLGLSTFLGFYNPDGNSKTKSHPPAYALALAFPHALRKALSHTPSFKARKFFAFPSTDLKTFSSIVPSAKHILCITGVFVPKRTALPSI